MRDRGRTRKSRIKRSLRTPRGGTDRDEVRLHQLIIMIALHKNPPIVSPACTSVRELEGQWWVAHTRSRHEKALAVDLVAQGVSYFLPMVERTLVVRKRRFKGMLPLFPGYVFFVGDASARYRALTTSHVANVIPVVDQERFVEELSQSSTRSRRLPAWTRFPISSRACDAGSKPVRWPACRALSCAGGG
jgi:hypothetical protein